MKNGLYRGLASDSDLVLVQTWDRRGKITNRTLTRALRWIRRKRQEYMMATDLARSQASIQLSDVSFE